MPEARSARKRLDQAMVALGLADSLEKARSLVMSAQVRVDGTPVTTSGHRIAPEQTISIDSGPDYYSRGGIKLSHALDHFHVTVEGLTALDVGASTGGFTHCLLQGGARHVYALDVGYGQLDYRLRQDSRVVVMERVNARNPFPLPETVDLVTVDVSFISLTRVLPSVASHLKRGGAIVALVKPQFEARRSEVGRGGVITDSRLHARVLGRVIAWVVRNGFGLRDLTPSPITGEKGNREFFLLVSQEQ